MTKKECEGGGATQEANCAACQMDDIFSYWCKSCNRSVSEKRCPYCGLKTQRKRLAEPG